MSQEVIAPASPDSLLTLCYFENWLVGFTTAEGCFCIRQSGNHSFSISQNYDSVILEAIKCKFELPNKVRPLPPPVKDSLSCKLATLSLFKP